MQKKQKKKHKKVRFPELLAVMLNRNIARAGFHRKKKIQPDIQDSIKNSSY